MTSFYPFMSHAGAGDDFPWWALFEYDEDSRRPGQSCAAAARRQCRPQEPQPSTSAAAYGPRKRRASPPPQMNKPNPHEFLTLANAFLPGIFEAVSAAAVNSANKPEASAGTPKNAEELLSTAAAFASTYFPDIFDAVTGAGVPQTKKDESQPQPATTATSLAKPTDKAFEVKLNVSEYSPHELNVKIVDRSVVVEGNQEEMDDGQGFVSRSFTRRFVVPDGVKIENVECKLTSDGFLLLSAPLVVETPVVNERSVPITLTSRPAAVAVTEVTPEPETISTSTASEQPKANTSPLPEVEDIGDEDTASGSMNIE